MMLDWEDVRHFLAVAQCRSLAGAARKMNVDRATVGRRIAALEAVLQVRLVDRLPRSCRLTPIGTQVFDWAVEMEAGADGIAEVVKAARSPIVGQVSLSVPPILIGHVFAEGMARFRNEHPHIHLSLSTNESALSSKSQDADIAVRLSRPEGAKEPARAIGTMHFGLYAHRAYANLEIPEQWQFIAFDQRFHDLPMQRWLLGIAGSRPVVGKLNRISEHLLAARAGMGIAGLPRFVGDRDTDLVRIHDDFPPLVLDLWLVRRQDLRVNRAVRAVMDFVEAVVADHPDLAPRMSSPAGGPRAARPIRMASARA